MSAAVSPQVIEGTFGRVTMDDLLQVVGLSRQCLEVVVTGVGTMTVKSGQVLQARVAGEVGVAAFLTLYASPATQYAVFRREPPMGLTPIGPVASLIERARRAPPRTNSSAVVVIEGSFGEMTLRELFDVLSVSRSTFEVELPGRRASLRLRGGQCLALAVEGEPDPVRALGSLLADPGGNYRVLRVSPARNVRTLGSLPELIARAEQIAEEYATVVEFPSGALITPRSRPSIRIEPPRSEPVAPRPTVDPRVDGLVAQVEALQKTPHLASEVLLTVSTLEERIAAQDERLAAWAATARQDRVLLVLALLVQLATAAGVVGASLWTHAWTQ